MEGEFFDRAKSIQQRILQLRDSLDCDAKTARLKEVETQMAEPAFWDHQERAQQVVAELKSLKSVLGPLDDVLRAARDLDELLEMADEDASLEREVVAEIERLESTLEELELKALLSGPYDNTGAILSIHARDGGTDANDWAQMLMRMYTLWAQKNEYDTAILDLQENEEAGIQNVTLAIRGPFAYGYLKNEQGIHRLVRISPFNAEGKRQTSFAAVDVSPEVSDAEEVEIDESDVRTDTFRASGAGGQHVNKTDSAIRLTHIPTGIVVQCQNERSQHKNRASAWKMLRARIARLEEERREAEQADKYKSKARVGFGSQIRNYFKHPDQRVKDTRTNHSEGNFDAVLDGNIQPFLDALLRWQVGKDE
ncbi:MAG: peptide chain release factor 2 [Planctomycetales bacterium]|nr:peptide chain release factor 2 [Planctomycetales bacterium]